MSARRASAKRASTKSASAGFRVRQRSRTQTTKRRAKPAPERWPGSGRFRAKTDTPQIPYPDPPRP